MANDKTLNSGRGMSIDLEESCCGVFYDFGLCVYQGQCVRTCGWAKKLRNLTECG